MEDGQYTMEAIKLIFATIRTKTSFPMASDFLHSKIFTIISNLIFKDEKTFFLKLVITAQENHLLANKTSNSILTKLQLSIFQLLL